MSGKTLINSVLPLQIYRNDNHSRYRYGQILTNPEAQVELPDENAVPPTPVLEDGQTLSDVYGKKFVVVNVEYEDEDDAPDAQPTPQQEEDVDVEGDDGDGQ